MRYLVGDTHISFLQFTFHHVSIAELTCLHIAKSLDFVRETIILITRT